MTRAGGKGRARIAARAEGAVHQNVTGVEGKPPHHLGKENRDMGRGGGNGSGHALPPFASICARTMGARRGSEAPFTPSGARSGGTESGITCSYCSVHY